MISPPVAMNGHSPQSETTLEVVAPDQTRQLVPLTHSPFLIGRGGAGDNNLQLADGRISRRCAVIVTGEDGYRLEDSGNRYGMFVNGVKVEQKLLEDGDTITFGIEGCFRVVFHCPSSPSRESRDSVASLITRLGTTSDASGPISGSGLSRLNLLLQATSLLHSQLPLDSVLSTMLDYAIAITHADRGLLLQPDAAGSMRVRLARSSGGESLPPETLNPSYTAVNQAVGRQSSVITEDLNLAGVDLKDAASVVLQNLRAVVAIPLHTRPRIDAEQSLSTHRSELLGVLYLDSRRIAAFSSIDRQILDALAVESASILDNARLVARERERQRLEQELNIAREIQQALLPKGLNDFPHLAVTGVHYPCHEVGGDYFDVFPIGEERVAFLIADVSGKGLGAALFTTMLQGALSGIAMGADPVNAFNHINRLLCRHARVGRYATLFIGMIDRHGIFEYIKAGHPSPLLVRRGQISELYTEGSFPVGLLPQAEYAARRLQLEPDDTLVLFSDGITEAQDPDRNLFEVEGLIDAIAGCHAMPLNNLQKSVLQAVQRFTRGASQSDDITLLLVRYRRPDGDGDPRQNVTTHHQRACQE
jgi:sigma-B regulation protein RsbU (phosphoserine phosphatase)